MMYAALYLAVVLVAAVWTLTLTAMLGTCGRAPICGPLQTPVVETA